MYQSYGGRHQTRCNYDQRRFQEGSDQTMHTEVNWGMDKTIEVAQGMILIIDVAMGIIQEVIKGMGCQIIAITEGETLEIKITTGIGVGHTKDRTETEGAVEVLVIVDQDQV